MFKSVLSALIIGGLTAGTALAEVPLWEGYWAANAKWCARAGDIGEATPDWIGRDGVFGLEWGCELTEVQPTGFPQSWSVKANCMDAGLSYSDAYIMLIDSNDRLLQLNQEGVIANLVRCPTPLPD